jgi:hypothetical protein
MKKLISTILIAILLLFPSTGIAKSRVYSHRTYTTHRVYTTHIKTHTTTHRIYTRHATKTYRRKK